jgi:hypothetical protein
MATNPGKIRLPACSADIAAVRPKIIVDTLYEAHADWAAGEPLADHIAIVEDPNAGACRDEASERPTRCLYFASMNTNGPRDCSSAPGIGWPPNPSLSSATQKSTASGVWSVFQASRTDDPGV